MAAAKKAKWGDSRTATSSTEHLCLRDGEPVDPETVDESVPGSGTRIPLYDGYEGMLYVSANRPVKLDEYEQIKKGQKKRPVRIIGPRKNADGRFDELTENDPYAPYSGCYANVILRIYGHEGKDGQPSRINASLEAVQFAKHGEAFGAKGSTSIRAFDEEDAGEDDIGGSEHRRSPPTNSHPGFGPPDEFGHRVIADNQSEDFGAVLLWSGCARSSDCVRTLSERAWLKRHRRMTSNPSSSATSRRIATTGSSASNGSTTARCCNSNCRNAPRHSTASG
jgi:hypothetical protein